MAARGGSLSRPERYARVREVFLAARELSPDERVELLDRACAGDRELRVEVESLLGRGDTSFLETPVSGSPGAIPERVGSYRILSVLGEGGMGVVYLAEQESPRRSVALKVIQPGISSPAHLRRLEHEAELLGRLHHPNVAQVYEAGTAASGAGARPWFAMELVHGEPLTAWAEERELGTRERLALFVKVCAGVQHAHEKGIIHRDLKPGNILVDERGEPKVLDFGIARATEGDLATATLRTGVGQILGTLPYMSPEQVACDSRGIDTRSDVYALGVIGYELLAGCLPYDVRAKPLPEAARIIREQDPTRLSSVHRVFRGDLETIFAKALEKDRDRRYASAAELAADVERHLAERPIQARPSSAAYQLSKFARRNKALVAGIAAVVVAALLGVAATAREASRTADQLVLARREARKATEIRKFLERTLASGVPGEKGIDAKVVEALDQAAADLAGAFRDEPEVEAALQHTIGSAYQTLGALAKAEPMLASALATRLATEGEEAQESRETMTSLAALLESRGRWDESEALHRRMLSIEQRIGGEDSPQALNAWNDLATLLILRGQASEAEVALRRASTGLARSLGADDPKALVARMNLANALEELGRMEESEAELRAAFAGFLRVRGPEHPETLTARVNLGTWLSSVGRYGEAAAALSEVLGADRRVLGPNHPDTWVAQNALANVLCSLERHVEAEALVRETLEAQTRDLGRDHDSTLASLRMLGSVLLRKGDPVGSETVLREAWTRSAAELGRSHAGTLAALQELARAVLAQRRRAEASPLFEEALAGRISKLGPRHPDTLASIEDLGMCRLYCGRAAEAEPLLCQTLEHLQGSLGVDHRRTLAALNNLGGALQTQARFEEAEVCFTEGLSRSEQLFGEADRDTVQVRANLARLYERTECWEDSEKLHRASFTIQAKIRGPSDEGALAAQLGLGTAIVRQGRIEEGSTILVEGLEIARNAGLSELMAAFERRLGSPSVARAE